MNKYLDSNIFLNAILYNDKKAEKCREILSRMVSQEFTGVTSILTWDEIVYVAIKNLGREIGVAEGNKFLKFPNLNLVDVNKNVIRKSQMLLEKYQSTP